jgi:hypothetical protein
MHVEELLSPLGCSNLERIRPTLVVKVANSQALNKDKTNNIKKV